MLRRGQSNRITRRKSAASIHSQPHINPETSRQQAYAAATYAFARAQERSSGDMGSGGAVAVRNTANPREENIHPRTDNGTNGGVLKHRQSVRFAGPLAAPRPALGTRTIQQNTVKNKLSTGSLRPQASTGDAPVPAAYRHQSRSSSLEKASFKQVGPESYATTLAAYDEYYTREDDAVTTPSSYRKIRRSKSMLHPTRTQGALFSNGTPESSIAGQRNNGLFRSKSNVALRAPKSMSFLQGGRSRSAQNPEYDTAVQVARDKFLHQVEQQRLREQPSFLFRSSKARREEKSLRRSFRTYSSTNSYGMPIASENQTSHQGWDDILKNRARQASKSFKNKLKGLFRRSNGGDGGAAIPDQEVQAQKSHITDYEIQIGPPTALGSAYEESPPGRATLSSVSARQPSLRMVPSSHQLRSIAGSMQSLTSEASSRSRVVSWTNTDTTANSRYAAAERERERLSVINENGTHKASLSFSRQPLKNQYSPYPDFNPPGSTHGHPPPFVGQVNSARVYSALMRRLDENSPEAKLTKQKDNSRTSRSPKHGVPGSGSVGSRQSSQGYKSTIIRVKNSSDNLFASADPFQNMNQSNDVFYTARSYIDNGSVGHKRGYSNSSSASTVITRKPNYRAYPPPIMGDLPAKTTLEEALVTVGLQGTVGRGPRETRSTFFGGTELTNIGGTPSPYKRAMAEADLNSTMSKIGMSSPDSSPFLPDSLRRAKSALSLADSEPDKREIDSIGGAYTESIYSRTTSGRTPPEMSEPPHASKDSTPRKLGSAVLVERTTYCPLAPPHRVNASTGSADWKAWMSAQVSKLERAKENVDAATSAVHLVPHVVPTMSKIFGGHVRETAQISGDDTALVVPTATTMPNQPLGVSHENANVSPKPILKSKLSSSCLLAPNATPTPSQRVIHSSLRQAPSRSSMKSVNTVLRERVVSNSAANIIGAPTGNASSSQGESAKARQRMLRKQSSATLRSVQTPNKLAKNNGRRASNDNAQLPSAGTGFVQMVAEKKFASVGGRVAGMENWTPAKVDGLAGDESVMVGGRGAELNGQVMGSRRMVDLFLSSRRKRVAGSEDSNVFL
ncbi:hypothetical protein V500_00850 [Pseudogymnoascus sp. VKM F-4518 (FW-2643)]|nr:hypothetical protein V500_00850 [Pseudogymnoascus sp. VKM F-4518 (FW-2643)]